MPLFLSQRDTTAREQMENPDCDLEELENTYRQFEHVNILIGRWRYLYQKYLRPYLHVRERRSLLDIGYGGGDIPRRLKRWAERDGVHLDITAIDPDPRAYRYVQQQTASSVIDYRVATLSDLDPEKTSFDFIISNHLLHHLKREELTTILHQSRRLCRHTILFNDLLRSDSAYALFNILSRPVFRSSMITEDGLTSIKRSYTAGELQEIVPTDWEVRSLFPFRLLLIHHHE